MGLSNKNLQRLSEGVHGRPAHERAISRKDLFHQGLSKLMLQSSLLMNRNTELLS